MGCRISEISYEEDTIKTKHLRTTYPRRYRSRHSVSWCRCIIHTSPNQIRQIKDPNSLRLPVARGATPIIVGSTANCDHRSIADSVACVSKSWGLTLIDFCPRERRYRKDPYFVEEPVGSAAAVQIPSSCQVKKFWYVS